MKRIITHLLAVLLLVPVISATASAQDSYRIKPGDVVRVEVLEDATLNRDAIVLPDGRISLPLAGNIKAGGRSVEEVRSDVIATLASNFATEPTVFVSLSQLAAPKATVSAAKSTNTIYILGEVANPGAHAVERGTTMLQALAQVGGFSQFAATKRIQLRRTDKSKKERIYNVNYKDILAGKTSIGTTVMESGDVIIVPQRRLFE
ncbi:MULTISPECIES: polysaccharide biosynthesis/export family protein [unclassified Roseovarius]|uniref:polysaccharide biosynthesis/export family protein n=1 Tax=unclassified Roseovarius TaxID=2614913 RepID=UPI00273F8CA4|nr:MULTISPECIES: polysaccharide biosynthesis/export family protein [unclassified Roseovarius]